MSDSNKSDLLVTRPVGVTAAKFSESGLSVVIVVMEDGSVWHTQSVGGPWTEGEPIPGSWRWSTWPKERNARGKTETDLDRSFNDQWSEQV
jgi:hypothetical protein